MSEQSKCNTHSKHNDLSGQLKENRLYSNRLLVFAEFFFSFHLSFSRHQMNQNTFSDGPQKTFQPDHFSSAYFLIAFHLMCFDVYRRSF